MLSISGRASVTITNDLSLPGSECGAQGSVEIEACQEQLRRYAQAGLRVLMCGVRELGQAEYRDWAASHAAAANALDKRDKLLLESYNRLLLTDIERITSFINKSSFA